MSVPTVSIRHLSKSFGAVTAVDDLTFDVRPGRVTGFLGPNGAGKTTTLRMLMGLVAPTSGYATFDGVAYADLDAPGSVVGAALESSGFHPGRSGREHLRMLTPYLGVAEARCDLLLDMVGLGAHGARRVGGYSTGMRQRLALAAALLGDPAVLVLDEPASGLDPEGIVWLRELLRRFAAEGRTVLVSSHVLSEVQSTVDDVVIIARGRLVHASSLDDLRAHAADHVLVRTPQPEDFERLCAQRRWPVEPAGDAFHVHGATGDEIGAAAFGGGIEIHQLTDRIETLEQLFLKLMASHGLDEGHAA